MGVYDFVLVEPGVELPNYDLNEEQFRVSWQTRSFRDPMFRLHLVSEDGFLYRADQSHDSTGSVESDDESSSFDLLEKIRQEDYSGYPRDEFEVEWFRVRFIGDMRITAQSDGNKMYDINFDRHSIESVWEIENPFGTNVERLQSGKKVYDRNDTSYVVVNVTDKNASEYIVSEEVVERGHTIYEERTVADMNPEYPDDDTVVEIEPSGGGRTIPVPASRVTDNIHSALQ